MADKISQKDYLKKYLSGSKNGDKKKKKKRQHRAVGGSLKIIDDDFDLSKLRTLDESELDLFNTNEDTPQIVGIVDDRPLEMKTLDEYQQNNKWKTFNNDLELSTNTPQNLKSSQTIIERQNYDSDASPPRLTKHIRSISDNNGSLPIQSDPTKKKYSVEIDCSPTRRRKARSPVSNRNVHSSSNQLLTIKVENSDSDCSPPRKASNREKSPEEYNISRRIDKHKSITRSQSPRYKLSSNDGNQNQTCNRNKTNEDVDRHRSKKQNTIYNSDGSLARQDRYKLQKVVQRQDSDNDNSPPRRRLHSESESKKMSKTLDGKTAGLQDAKSLRVENESMKRRENELFNALDEKKSGRNAETIVRDRKTGKKRDLEQEQKHESEKREKNTERTEKYSRWGRGLKQDADYKARLQSDLHEMSKPLARYADDTDLEKHLRDKDRAGDPMLDYMRRKEMENKVTQGIEVKPLFKGSFPANRFDIRPGYRWDGVNRSNGYEKSWFENINSKKATEEAAYKWSTEDM